MTTFIFLLPSLASENKVTATAQEIMMTSVDNLFQNLAYCSNLSLNTGASHCNPTYMATNSQRLQEWLVSKTFPVPVKMRVIFPKHGALFQATNQESITNPISAAIKSTGKTEQVTYGNPDHYLEAFSSIKKTLIERRRAGGWELCIIFQYHHVMFKWPINNIKNIICCISQFINVWGGTLPDFFSPCE